MRAGDLPLLVAMGINSNQISHPGDRNKIFFEANKQANWVGGRRKEGEGSGTPLQCSCLENPRDGGAWWAAVPGVAKSWT